MTTHGLTGVADAGVFLARLTRLDPTAPVRLRRRPTGTALWGRVPWGVLVTREVAGAGPDDVTVAAAELLEALAADEATLPRPHDERWRWALPPASAEAVEAVAVAELSRLAAAAADTVRAASRPGAGGGVGQRMMRDALLDHVALVVTPPAGAPVEVPLRLVQAVARMGFLGAAGRVAGVAQVCVAGRWVAISAPYGVAWLPPVNTLTVRPIGAHLNG